MSYNSARHELFLADNFNQVVRVIHLHDKPGDLGDVYRGSIPETRILSVCHMSDSDTLLVCSNEKVNYLVALIRSGSGWREAQRVQTIIPGWICIALSESQVLIGQYGSKCLELYRVESGPIIERVHRLQLDTEYISFSATRDTETRVAVSYLNSTTSEVRVHRLVDDRLEEVARTRVENPGFLLWLLDTLLATEGYDKSVHEIDVSTRLDRELIAPDEGIRVESWCAVDDGLAIFDMNSKGLLHYKYCP